jgi:hypothetical protein
VFGFSLFYGINWFSEIWDSNFTISDLGIKKALAPGSGSATWNRKIFKYFQPKSFRKYDPEPAVKKALDPVSRIQTPTVA